MVAVLLSLVAALGYGVADFTGGLAARRITAIRVVVISYPVGALGLLLVSPLVGGSVTVSSLVYGTIAGVISSLAILWFYAALAAGPMSVVSPLTSLLVAGIPLGVGLFWGERPGSMALFGAGLAVIAVVLVSRQERSAVDEGAPVRFTPKVAWLTVGSGVGFGIFFVLLDRMGHDTGLWPLALSRVIASGLILVAAAFTGRWRPARGVPLRLAVTAGLLDMVSNVAFTYAVRVGLLSLVSVLTSMYPAGTVLLARIVLREHASVLQRIGLVMAAVAVMLIAAAPATG